MSARGREHCNWRGIVGWAKARAKLTRLAKRTAQRRAHAQDKSEHVGKIARRPCLAANGTVGDFAHPTSLA